MILVVGATGMLGRQVTTDLLADGHRVRAACREPSAATGLEAAGAEIARIDVCDPSTFTPSLAGIEVMFTAVHGLMGRAASSVTQVDVEGQKRLIDAAAAVGVKRYVHTSVQNADPESPILFLRAKAATEQYLMASSLDWTILRPTAFADLYAHNLIGKSVIAGKPVWLLGNGTTRRNMVAIADVSRVAVRALTENGFSSQVIEIGGPDNVTGHEVAGLYGRLSGKIPRVHTLSPRALRWIGALVGPLHGGARSLLNFVADSDEDTDLEFDASAMPALLGRKPMSLEQLARARSPA